MGRRHTTITFVLVPTGLFLLLQLYQLPSIHYKYSADAGFPRRKLLLTLPTKTTPTIPQRCPKTTARAALCVVVKDEEAYIDEFVNYHLALGFDTIYLYDNAETFELGQWGERKQSMLNEVLHPKPHHCPGRRPQQQLIVQHAPGSGRQNELFQTCARIADGQGHTWAAFFDADEYLVLRHNRESGSDNNAKATSEPIHVADYLQQAMPNGGSLAIQWVQMTTAAAVADANNISKNFHPTDNNTPRQKDRRVTYAPVPLTFRYQYRDITEFGLEDGRHIKTIVKLADMDLEGKRKNPHVVPLLPGKFQRNVWGEIMEGPKVPEVEGTLHGLNRTAPASLYHYGTKSYKEYWRKRQRGRGSVAADHASNAQLLAQAHAMLQNATTTPERKKDGDSPVVYDPTAWEHLQQLVPTYSIWNDPRWNTLIAA